MSKSVSSRVPSTRQLKVGEEIRRILSDILQRDELHEPLLEGFKVIISEVRPSPDFSVAKVFVAPVGGEDVKNLLKKLEEHKGYLRKKIGSNIRLRVTPDLTFLADNSYDEAGHIEKLLHLPEVQRDLTDRTEE